MRKFSLDTPLQDALGTRAANAIKKSFDYETVEDLLNHTPRRYQKMGEYTRLADLQEGEDATVLAEILSVKQVQSFGGKKPMLRVVITDGSSYLDLTWFNRAWVPKELRVGARGIFSGKVKTFRGNVQLTHPQYTMTSELHEAESDGEALAAREWSLAPMPIYAATASLRSIQIQKHIAKLLAGLERLDDPIPEWILRLFPKNNRLLSLGETYERIHRPADDSEWRYALASLKFREAFALQIGLQHRKLMIQNTSGVPRPRVQGENLDRFDASLPYTLTTDQSRVGEVIAEDLASGSPMHRLLQGEVGSGKTLVALRAMLQVTDLNAQAVLLAPTEVLANQHLRSIEELLGPKLIEKLHPTLLTGQLNAKAKREASLAIELGRAKIIVGTHALMSEGVTFTDLGLIVIDEQHRFGVEQREALRQKAKLPPHVLVMTATPIPRTVALTAFGDLEISTLKKMPAGRANIESHVVPLLEKPGWLDRALVRAGEEIEKGRQVYIVCAAISDSQQTIESSEPAVGAGDEVYSGAASEVANAPSSSEYAATELEFEAADQKRVLFNVENTLEHVRSHPVLKKYRSEALTGELPSDEKDSVMRSFAADETKILVATTVIEVGVNVPNASLMIVLDADRFGVSQLHQLRGRIGRGTHPGLCIFVTPAPTNSLAYERVKTVASTLDGFKLAQADLEMRKEGDVLGHIQSGGSSSLKWVRVVQDQQVIEVAADYAKRLLQTDPALKTVPYYRDFVAQTAAKTKISKLYQS